MESEIQVDDYKTLWPDTNRYGGSEAYYIRNDLSYNICFFTWKQKCFFVILLTNSKPVTGKKEVRKERRIAAQGLEALKQKAR